MSKDCLNALGSITEEQLKFMRLAIIESIPRATLTDELENELTKEIYKSSSKINNYLNRIKLPEMKAFSLEKIDYYIDIIIKDYESVKENAYLIVPKINYNTDFLEEDDFESKTESEKLDTVADELYYRYTSQSENIGNVTDTRTNTEYPGCFFVELSQLDEKFAPQGAENILDAVNKSTEWNGRLEDAYKELFTLLDCIRAIQSDEQFNDYETSLASVFHSVGDYTEGSTNLTYLFADKETQTIYTNKKCVQQLRTAGAEP